MQRQRVRLPHSTSPRLSPQWKGGGDAGGDPRPTSSLGVQVYGSFAQTAPFDTHLMSLAAHLTF